eukprot:1155998-Pelagomonas_calceolata.AAC.5
MISGLSLGHYGSLPCSFNWDTAVSSLNVCKGSPLIKLAQCKGHMPEFETPGSLPMPNGIQSLQQIRTASEHTLWLASSRDAPIGMHYSRPQTTSLPVHAFPCRPPTPSRQTRKSPSQSGAGSRCWRRNLCFPEDNLPGLGCGETTIHPYGCGRHSSLQHVCWGQAFAAPSASHPEFESTGHVSRAQPLEERKGLHSCTCLRGQLS